MEGCRLGVSGLEDLGLQLVNHNSHYRTVKMDCQGGIKTQQDFWGRRKPYNVILKDRPAIFGFKGSACDLDFYS